MFRFVCGGDFVSTEIHVAGLSSSVPGALELTMEFDRVLLTAADRPDTDTLPALTDPAADHGDAELTATARRCRGEASAGSRIPRRDRARRRGAGAGRLGRVVHVRRRPGPGLRLGAGSILLFINRTCRAVITDNVQSAACSRKSLPASASSSRSGPGTTTRSRSSPSCATTSGSRPTWAGTAARPLRREVDALRA